jgi:secondary thiamine-phosphate synthase enzyme
MKIQNHIFEVKTRGKGTYEITADVARFVAESGIRDGQVTVMVRHTSASLVIMENADPEARHDLAEFFERLVKINRIFLNHFHGLYALYTRLFCNLIFTFIFVVL